MEKKDVIKRFTDFAETEISIKRGRFENSRVLPSYDKPEYRVPKNEKQRELTLEDRVYDAYCNPRPVTLIRDPEDPTIMVIKEDIESATKRKAELEKASSGALITITPSEPKPSEVVTTDPDEYLELLRMAHMKMAGFGNGNLALVEKKVKENYEHELAHAMSGLTVPTLEISYKVDFVVRRERHGLFSADDMIPSIALRGQLDKKTYLAILQGPEDLSEYDRAMLPDIVDEK